MTDANKMTRRSWFRLRTPLSERETPISVETTAVGDNAKGLVDVERPPNHDGMDLSQLPPMREAMLDATQVEALCNDIAACGSDILLMQRSTRSSQAGAATPDSGRNLIAAREALLSGQIARIQIRYRWNGNLWIDTLEAKPTGYRLIRIAHAGR